MRDGFEIYDSDTHVSPMGETLEPYFDTAMRKRLPERESGKVPFRVGWAGEILQPPYRHRYQFKKRAGWREALRVLGEAGLREHIAPHFPRFMGSRFPTPGGSVSHDFNHRVFRQLGATSTVGHRNIPSLIQLTFSLNRLHDVPRTTG